MNTENWWVSIIKSQSGFFFILTHNTKQSRFLFLFSLEVWATECGFLVGLMGLWDYSAS